MNEVISKFPEISGLVDSKVERELFLAFKRVYEILGILEEKFSQFKQDQSSQISAIKNTSDSLVSNLLAIPLIGETNPANPLVGVGSGTVSNFTVTDAAIFNVTDPLTTPNLNLKVQNANKVLSGPATGADAVPTFRKLVVADADNNLWSLSKLDLKVLKTDDGLTKITAAAPYTNDGYITIKDNAGNEIKILTTLG